MSENVDRYIAHLERELAHAKEREQQLLDMVSNFTRSGSVEPTTETLEPEPQAAAQTPKAAAKPTAKAAAPKAAAPAETRPVLTDVRKQIVDLLHQHPKKGFSARDVQEMLKAKKDLRPTLKGMLRAGIITRLEAGRYTVAKGW